MCVHCEVYFGPFDLTDWVYIMCCVHKVSEVFLSLSGKMWFGVDITREDITDNFSSFVWEPAIVKRNSITGAIEAATLILSVDETIRNPKSSSDGPPGALPSRGRGGKPRRDLP